MSGRTGQASRIFAVGFGILALGVSIPARARHGEEPPRRSLAPLVIGIDAAFPPHQYLDERGDPAGFDVELARAVAAVEGLEVSFLAGPWDEVRSALERGEIDAIPGVVRTEELEQTLDFTVPTVLAEHVLFVRRDATIRDLRDLAGQRVAVERSHFWHVRLRERYPEVTPVVTSAPDVALQMLEAGEVEAAILLQYQGLYFVREHDLANVRSAGPPLDLSRYRFAVSEGHDTLLAKLNDGLARVWVEGTYDRLWDAWFGVLHPKPLINRRLAGVLGAGAALLLLLLGVSFRWSRVLEHRVQIRTEQLRESDVENRALQRQVLLSQKMEALGRLAGSVAHDFNNVLTTVIGNAALATKEAGSQPEIARSLEAITRAASMGARLTRQILSFGRRQPGEARPINWNDLVGDDRDILDRLVGSRVELHLNEEPALWPVRIDPTQASQILMNLVTNACDAMGGAGRIEIETLNLPGSDGDRVSLRVRDDGAGMDAETRERIFEPFFSTKGDDGTGLGLATVYGIVTRHGGEIEVESTPGAGACFDVILPRSRVDEASKEPPATEHLAEDAPVLLVEADAAVRGVGEALLLSLKHPVVSVESGEEALRQLRAHRDVGLVITDAELRGFPGLALARALLEERPSLRVLLSSETARCVELEADARVGHLPKPYTQESLQEALERVYSG